jgi:hypothetical protein
MCCSIWSEDLERDQEMKLVAGLFQGVMGSVLWSRDCIEPNGYGHFSSCIMMM